MKTFIACLFIIHAAYTYSLKRKLKSQHITPDPEELPPVQISFIEIERMIDSLNELKEQLENIENMITDIESCAPEERATAFHISTSSRHSVNLLANSSSIAILDVLKEERKKVRSSIVEILLNFPGMNQKNIEKTCIKNNDRGVV